MFEIKPAQRQGTPALIAFWGPSGSGKTYTALLVARGLVGQKGKIVLIDTENHRASIYAELAGAKPWYHMDLQPPFTPQRYTEAMKAAEAGDGDVIIIDSASHVWEGEGGVLDMAESSGSKGILKWKDPKMAYKRMLNALLRSRVNVIFCLRAKDKNVQRKDSKGNTEIVNLGLVPICEKNFIYEMTVAARLEQNHLPVDIKVPEDLADAVPPGRVLAANTGELITQWIEGGAPVNHELEALKRAGREVATFGTQKLKEWWEQQVSKTDKAMLVSYKDEFKHLASQADAEATDEGGPTQEPSTAEQTGDPLTDDFTGNGPDNEAETKKGKTAESQEEPPPSDETNGETSADNGADTSGILTINGIHGRPAQYENLDAWVRAMTTKLAGYKDRNDYDTFWANNASNLAEAQKVDAGAVGGVITAYQEGLERFEAAAKDDGELAV